MEYNIDKLSTTNIFFDLIYDIQIKYVLFFFHINFFLLQRTLLLVVSPIYGDKYKMKNMNNKELYMGKSKFSLNFGKSLII